MLRPSRLFAQRLPLGVRVNAPRATLTCFSNSFSELRQHGLAKFERRCVNRSDIHPL